MDNPEKLNKFNLDKIKNITPDKENSIFFLSLLLSLIILIKIFFLIIYYFKAESIFHNTPVCETYKSLYASELNKGDSANIQPILEQAGNEKCVKPIEVKNTTNTDKQKNNKKTDIKEDKAYNSLTIHEIDKK